MTRSPTAPRRPARPRPSTRDDLQSLPVSDVEKQLGSSPDGLSQAEAERRLTQYGPNEIAESKTNPLLKFLSYFWGPIPWMIEVAVILSGAVGHWADFFIILVLLMANAVVGYCGGASGRQRHRRPEGQAGDHRTGQARRHMGHAPRARAGARRRHPPASGRHRARRRAAARRRRDRGRPVRADRGVAARHPQGRRRGVLRLDHAPRRDRRPGLRHRRQHLLRQDRRAGRRRAHRQPLPARRAEDRQLPDHPRRRPGRGHRRRLDRSAATRCSPRCSSRWC